LAQRRFQIGRPAVLAQQVGKRLVGELLKRRNAVARQDIERGPGFVVELHPLARHAARSFRPHLIRNCERPAFARPASYGGFESAEARSAKAEAKQSRDHIG
jgi:hypothetical protein